MVRFTVRWPGRRKAWTATSGAIAFVLASGMVLSHPGPPPPPPPVTSERQVVVATPTTPISTTFTAQPVTITTTPADPNRGITVYATPLGDGRLSMTETVRFNNPQTHLTLSPPKVKDAGPAFKGLTPTVSQIELTADSQDLRISTRTLTAPLFVVLPGKGVMRVDVRYLLDGVVAAATGSSPATALVAPLIDGHDDQLTVSYVIGSQIDSFACPQLQTPQAQADCQEQGASNPDVGLISGLPSSNALLVIGLPPETPKPSDTKRPSPSPSPSSSSSPPSSPPSTQPTPTSTPSDSPPPSTPTPDPTTPAVTTPPPTDTPSGVTTTTPPPAPTPDPTPTVTVTATPSPTDAPTSTTNGTDPTTSPSTPAAGPATATDGVSASASQAASRAASPAASRDAATLPAVDPSAATPPATAAP